LEVDIYTKIVYGQFPKEYMKYVSLTEYRLKVGPHTFVE